MLAGDVMTQEVISVAPDASVMQAGALMLKHQISGLPVVAPSGILLGITARATFCGGPSSEPGVAESDGWSS